jgi:hypothetical protein
MNFFCDVISQRFLKGFRIPSVADIIVTQNNDIEGKFYLVQPNGSSRFPFMYDPNSGDAGLIAKATLCNPGGTPLTLTEPTTLSAILNGFTGIIRTSTEQIATFLAGYTERKCQLAIEVTDIDGNHVTDFQSELTLRSASTGADVEVIAGVIRDKRITGYLGGGPTNLDGVVTADKPIGTRWDVTLTIGGARAESHWEYTGPGATPSDPDSGIILTTDGGQLVRTIGL